MFVESTLRFIPSNQSLAYLLPMIVGLIIIWIIVSIPVYVAGKIVKGRKASFGSALAATLIGPIVYVVVLFGVNLFLVDLIGPSAPVWAFILAFIAWLGVYKSVFQTGWIGALAIAVLSVIILFILNMLLPVIFGVVMPGTFFPAPFMHPF